MEGLHLKIMCKHIQEAPDQRDSWEELFSKKCPSVVSMYVVNI